MPGLPEREGPTRCPEIVSPMTPAQRRVVWTPDPRRWAALDQRAEHSRWSPSSDEPEYDETGEVEEPCYPEPSDDSLAAQEEEAMHIPASPPYSGDDVAWYLETQRAAQRGLARARPN